MKQTAFPLLLILAFALTCCSEYVPKPRGYYRIDLPKEVNYATFDEEGYPYKFEYSDFGTVKPVTQNDSFWVDVLYPKLNAKLYCSYKPIRGNFQEIAEDSRTFVYKHIVKADDITEQPYENAEHRIYGLLYELKGNTASNIQFILTDSSKHFFRGSLYFASSPNKDSIQPVLNFIRKDIIHIIETLEWKENK